MRTAKCLQLAFVFLIVTRITLITSAAQTGLVRRLSIFADELNNEHSNPLAKTSPTLGEESRNSSSPPAMPEPLALTSRDPRKLGLLDRAYLDAFTILNDQNECSRFFGGKDAIAALTQLILQLKPTYLDQSIAIRMGGNITTYQSHRTGFSFRLFDKAEINLASSFYRSNGPSERQVLSVPGFRPNTRETRVVMLLHELGHLVKTANDRWVLPDDGSDPELSLVNTEQVVSVCRQQIRSIARLTHAQELEMTQSAARCLNRLDRETRDGKAEELSHTNNRSDLTRLVCPFAASPRQTLPPVRTTKSPFGHKPFPAGVN